MTDGLIDTTYEVLIVLHSISLILAGATIFILILKLRRIKKWCLSKVVMIMLLTSVIHLSFLLGPLVSFEVISTSSLWCNLQGILFVYSTLSAISWIFFLILDFLNVVRPFESYKYVPVLSHLVSWLFPLFSVIGFSIGGKMEFLMFQCWPNFDITTYLITQGFSSLQLIIGCFLLFSIIIKASRIINTQRKLKSYITQHAVGFIIVVIIWAYSQARFIWIIMDIDSIKSHPISLVLNSLILSVLGIVGFLVFGFNRYHLSELQNFLWKN
eukprot:TRINITY_DN24217_c0_g1_i1.p1 TRINITY_DN24217_c0_g1~~TRINITY_DN24217_c0_g1_i1.p1  ORF type:complete len:270 (-),score=31.21 TRINITY_DN24217_c0_g1_i1:36-845(-)